jgi:hypothetical protein
MARVGLYSWRSGIRPIFFNIVSYGPGARQRPRNRRDSSLCYAVEVSTNGSF